MKQYQLASSQFIQISWLLFIPIILGSIVGCRGFVEEQAEESVQVSTKIEVVEPGNGDVVKDDSVVVIEYTGYLANGTQFDKSEAPFCFTMGGDKIIEGLENGLSSNRAGAQLNLTVPPGEAYGEEGFGTLIPSNATLTYTVEIITVLPAELTRAIFPFDTTNFDEMEHIDEGIGYVDLNVGRGISVAPGRTALMHYTCWGRDSRQINSTIESRPRTESDKCNPLRLVLPPATTHDSLSDSKLISASETLTPTRIATDTSDSGNISAGHALTTTNAITGTADTTAETGILGTIIEGMKPSGQRLVLIEETTDAVSRLQSRLVCNTAEMGAVLVVLTDVQ